MKKADPEKILFSSGDFLQFHYYFKVNPILSRLFPLSFLEFLWLHLKKKKEEMREKGNIGKKREKLEKRRKKKMGENAGNCPFENNRVCPVTIKLSKRRSRPYKKFRRSESRDGIF